MTHQELIAELDRTWKWLITKFSAMSDEERTTAATASEHDEEVKWSPQDHFIHLFGIEKRFSTLIQRFVDGDENPLGVMMVDSDGKPREQAQILAGVHADNERWLTMHGDKSFDELVAVAEGVRAKTLAQIASLTEEQMAMKIPLAPWNGGTVAGIIAANCGHATMHVNWLKEANI